MIQFFKPLSVALAVSTVLLAACGGGSNSVEVTPTAPETAAKIDMSVSALFNYLGTVVADMSDSVVAIDVNALTLATDDTAEPTAMN